MCLSGSQRGLPRVLRARLVWCVPSPGVVPGPVLEHCYVLQGLTQDLPTMPMEGMRARVQQVSGCTHGKLKGGTGQAEGMSRPHGEQEWLEI